MDSGIIRQFEELLTGAVNKYLGGGCKGEVRSFLADYFAPGEEQAASRARHRDGGAAPIGGWSVTEWLRSLNLHEVAAPVIAAPVGADAFDHVVAMPLTMMDAKLRDSGLSGLSARIQDGIEALKASGDVRSGAQLNSKFATESGTFVMAFASLDQFFSGLEGLIGSPSMFRGSLLAQMAREHTMQADSRVAFSTSNGLRGTTSEREYEFVVAGTMADGIPKRDYPERDGWRASNRSRCRVPISLAELEQRMSMLTRLERVAFAS